MVLFSSSKRIHRKPVTKQVTGARIRGYYSSSTVNIKYSENLLSAGWLQVPSISYIWTPVIREPERWMDVGWMASGSVRGAGAGWAWFASWAAVERRDSPATSTAFMCAGPWGWWLVDGITGDT
jgi:hypothetical protein